MEMVHVKPQGGMKKTSIARDAEILAVSASMVRRRRGLARFVVGLLMLPWKVSRWVSRVTLQISALPLRFASLSVRVMKIRGMVLFVVGFLAGLLLAPWPGQVLRDKVLRLIMTMAKPTDGMLIERVRAALAGAPRTWHLQQPDVSVVDGHVILEGEVATMTARDEFIRLATCVPGVKSVDGDGLTVVPASTPGAAVGDPALT